MYRKSISVFLILFLFAIPGYANIALSILQKVPVHNWIYIHPDYKVGDYAIFENMDNAQKMKFEIVGIENKLIEVKMSWIKTQTIIAFLKNISYHLFVQKNGYVKKAFMYDSKRNVEMPLKIAGPGDYNYVKDSKSMLVKRKEIITTKAGRFEIDNVIVFKQRISNLGVKTNVTSIYFIHPGVKFGLVRQTHVVESHVSLVELSGYIVELSPLSKTQKSIMNYIIDKAKNQKYIQRIDLIETN